MDKKSKLNKKLKKLRSLEEKISYANPKACAKLTVKIVKLKNGFFNGQKSQEGI